MTGRPEPSPLQDHRITGWQDGRMAGSQDGRTTGWQDHHRPQDHNTTLQTRCIRGRLLGRAGRHPETPPPPGYNRERPSVFLGTIQGKGLAAAKRTLRHQGRKECQRLAPKPVNSTEGTTEQRASALLNSSPPTRNVQFGVSSQRLQTHTTGVNGHAAGCETTLSPTCIHEQSATHTQFLMTGRSMQDLLGLIRGPVLTIPLRARTHAHGHWRPCRTLECRRGRCCELTARGSNHQKEGLWTPVGGGNALRSPPPFVLTLRTLLPGFVSLQLYLSLVHPFCGPTWRSSAHVLCSDVCSRWPSCARKDPVVRVA